MLSECPSSTVFPRVLNSFLPSSRFTQNCCYIAALCTPRERWNASSALTYSRASGCFVFDFCVTLDRQVEFMWKRKISAPSLLFFVLQATTFCYYGSWLGLMFTNNCLVCEFARCIPEFLLTWLAEVRTRITERPLS